MQKGIFAEVTDFVASTIIEDTTFPPKNLANEYSAHIFNAKYTISLSNVEKRTENSLMKSNFIAYEIKITRSSDGESHSVWKRFKELYAWYYDLISELEELEFNKAIVFPTYGDSWLSSSSKADISSAFVQKRRVDLQNFFNSLFNQHPKMFSHPKVEELLQLHRFSPESNRSGGSVYSKPESYYDVYASNGTGSSSNGKSVGAGQTVSSFSTPTLQQQNQVETYTRAAPPMPYKSGGKPAVIDFSSTSRTRRDDGRDRDGELKSAAAVVAPQTEWSV